MGKSSCAAGRGTESVEEYTTPSESDNPSDDNTL